MQLNYLSKGPISHKIIASLLDQISKKTDAGGHAFFLGQVRADKIDGKIVRAIEYSAYEGLVKAESMKIKAVIMEEFSDVKTIDIIHSTGIVNTGEISLLVMVSAGHRKHALEACSKTVDLIKEKLPVWKKELYEDSTHTWK
jgi:molybdopterin synthase catalytic subunit